MQHCADVCLICGSRKVYMPDYADFCLMHAFKEAEMQNTPGSFLLCSCKEAEVIPAAPVCVCRSAKHDAACCLTAHSEAKFFVSTPKSIPGIMT